MADRSEEFARFNALVGKVLAVPKLVLDQRLKEESEPKSTAKRRGIKPKTTPKPSR